MADVVVIGGGIAGLTAARLLAQAGKAVVLCRRTPGRSAHGAGAWQLAHSTAVWASAQESGEAAASTVRAHVADLALHHRVHPFAKWGIEASTTAILEGIAPFVAEPKLAYLPLSNGTLQPAVPEPLTARVAYTAEAKPGIVAVLDLSAYGAPLSPRCVLTWQYDASRDGIGMPLMRSVSVPVAPGLPPLAKAHAYGLARSLHTADGFAAFATTVRPLLEAKDATVWLPPVLGIENAASLCQRFSEAWGGRAVAEASGGVGSQQGPRRLLAMETACAAAGVSFAAGVASAETNGDVCLSLTLTDGTRIAAKSYVLATGRFLGGGLLWPSQQRCREAIFGLPLRTPLGPWKRRSVLESTGRTPHARHEWAEAGVATDAQQRPLEAESGRVLLRNVHAAGGLLGGWSELHTPSRDGVALASATMAARAITGGSSPAQGAA